MKRLAVVGDLAEEGERLRNSAIDQTSLRIILSRNGTAALNSDIVVVHQGQATGWTIAEIAPPHTRTASAFYRSGLDDNPPAGNCCKTEDWPMDAEDLLPFRVAEMLNDLSE